MIALILATNNKGLIGNKGKLPWRCPEDLKEFRNITRNMNLIVGKKTFDKLPMVLRNRNIICATRQFDLRWMTDNIIAHYKECSTFSLSGCIDEYIDVLKESNTMFMVIGGAEMYSLFYPHACKIYHSIIHNTDDLEGDAYFKEFEQMYHDFDEVEKNEFSSFIQRILERK